MHPEIQTVSHVNFPSPAGHQPTRYIQPCSPPRTWCAGMTVQVSGSLVPSSSTLYVTSFTVLQVAVNKVWGFRYNSLCHVCLGH